MTYKEIVDRFKDVTNQHYMLKGFGYGQLSDIKVLAQDGEANYPYLFLNPTTHKRSGVIMSYNFNMIVMDIAIDEDNEHGNFLAIQSKCQQYIDDVIAELYYGYVDKPEIIYSNITYNPFKERFQDSVAGMTATIQIDVPTPINQCIAPIEAECAPVDCVLSDWSDWSSCNNGTQTRTRTVITPSTCGGVECGPLVETKSCDDYGCLVVDVYSVDPQTFDPDLGQSPISCPNIVLTDGGWRTTPPWNYYIAQTGNPYTWVVEGTAIVTVANPTDAWSTPFQLLDTGNGTYYDPTDEYDINGNLIPTGWPATKPPVGTQFNFRLTYQFVQPANTSNFQMVLLRDYPGPQCEIQTQPGVNIKIYDVFC
jgi:hypothetical protein